MLYHKEVGWPARVEKKLPFGKRKLFYTQHAKKAAKTDRYLKEMEGFDTIPLVPDIDLTRCTIFEAEETDKNGRLDKVVFRTTFNTKLDIVFACKPAAGGLIVKTLWLNIKDDNHNTLKTENYAHAH